MKMKRGNNQGSSAQEAPSYWSRIEFQDGWGLELHLLLGICDFLEPDPVPLPGLAWGYCEEWEGRGQARKCCEEFDMMFLLIT